MRSPDEIAAASGDSSSAEHQAENFRCRGYWNRALSRYADHPADAETVGEHAEARRPKRLSQRHLHLATLSEPGACLEDHRHLARACPHHRYPTEVEGDRRAGAASKAFKVFRSKVELFPLNGKLVYHFRSENHADVPAR